MQGLEEETDRVLGIYGQRGPKSLDRDDRYCFQFNGSDPIYI